MATAEVNTLENPVAVPTLRGHIEIARIDYWFKNVFVLPGIVVAMGMAGLRPGIDMLVRCLIGLAAVCLTASSNYVLNELLDAPYDRKHETKRNRPVASGRVHVPLAFVQWIALMICGLTLARTVAPQLMWTMLWLWCMGCIYNIPPVRSKELPYLDVLSEAINNPIRMVAGWYMAGALAVPPASLLMSYWMVGCYFMALKRFAEYREIGDPVKAALYRKSFGYYTEQKLLISVMFYASAAMLFLGAFAMRYRMELVLAFPFVALVMAVYLSLSFKENSAAGSPETLYREPGLVFSVLACCIAIGVLMMVDIPGLYQLFVPTATITGSPR